MTQGGATAHWGAHLVEYLLVEVEAGAVRLADIGEEGPVDDLRAGAAGGELGPAAGAEGGAALGIAFNLALRY